MEVEVKKEVEVEERGSSGRKRRDRADGWRVG